MNEEFIRRLAEREQVCIAVVYPSWFEDGESLPRDWKLVAHWDTPARYVAADSRVSFYAVGEESDRLRQHLRDFQTALPPEVQVTVL